MLVVDQLSPSEAGCVCTLLSVGFMNLNLSNVSQALPGWNMFIKLEMGYLTSLFRVYLFHFSRDHLSVFIF